MNSEQLALALLQLERRNEHSLDFTKIREGIIISRHGKHTINYWRYRGDDFICYHTESIGY